MPMAPLPSGRTTSYFPILPEISLGPEAWLSACSLITRRARAWEKARYPFGFKNKTRGVSRSEHTLRESSA